MSENLHNSTDFKSDPLSERWIDLRLVSATRLMLAASALLVFLIDPLQGRYTPFTYEALALYTIYSAILVFLSIRRSHLVPAQYMHWLDMVWFLVLSALSSGANSIFFNFFFFAILVASFGWGYLSGLRLTLVSASLFTIVGVFTADIGLKADLNRFLLRPIALLILGFMISRWGGFKINLRNRLQLLKDITVFSNARFGIHRTITSILERLRSFYDADACLLLIRARESENSSYQMYRVRRGVHATGASPPEITAEAAQLFLLPSAHHAVVHLRDGQGQTSLFDVNAREFSIGDSEVSDRVASALEATNYLSIPVQNRNQPIGRLYVIGGPQRYDNSAIDFVLQLMDHVTPLIENIRLVDSLASYAAEEERRRIARDIHDSVIQPYVGLQLGIAALAQKLHAGNTDVVNNVEELLELTNQELVELRRYVWGLRAGEERRDVLLPAIERFVGRFTSVTGIRVNVNSHGKIEINDRLAAEIFQMITEGLSNVRRHALCNEASVDLSCTNGKIILQIKNRRPGVSDSPNGDDHHEELVLFRPRSIAERATLLGGNTVVSIADKNYTVVTIAIPL
ncbi:MAG TPA: histidine kinase [Pyrinomonadaceae bacterium]|nr:histidine kinase [Pyrinomonadaceae bacterium]